jgi:hypothetical protein
LLSNGSTCAAYAAVHLTGYFMPEYGDDSDDEVGLYKLNPVDPRACFPRLNG